MTPAEIADLIRKYKFHYWKEAKLQEGLETLFAVEGIEFSREVRLGERARIDFLIEGVGLEVKVAGGQGKVERQLTRYSKFEQIEGLVLVTNRLRHKFPSELNGKPLEVVYLTLQNL